MKSFLVAVLFVLVSQIEGGYYYKRQDAGTVAENMRQEAEIAAMRKADEMPLMETARLMRNTNPVASERLAEVVGNSASVRRAAAEGAVKRAVEMGAVKRSEERKLVTRLMDSPMVERAATEAAARMVDEPSNTRNLVSKRNSLRTESELLKRMQEDVRSDGVITKRDEEVIRRTVEKVTKARAEEILRDATEGKAVRSDEVKPLVNALRNSEELRQAGAEAAVIAARRMDLPLSHGLEQVKRSELVREAVQEGVLQAVDDLRMNGSTARMNRPLTTMQNALNVHAINRAVMDAAMEIAGRLQMLRRAATSNNAVELVRMSAEKPIVRLEAAKRAMEIAVDNGIIEQRSATPQLLREVANLPSIRSIAAMGTVKKAVEMGVTA